MSHLFRFGGKPAGLLYGTKQEEGAVLPELTEIKILELLVTADGGRSERLPTWLSMFRKRSRGKQETGLPGNVLK